VDNGTRWVGIDLHRRRSQIAVIDQNGELALSRRIVNDRDTFLELLGDPNDAHVVLEATYGWEWLAELLEEAGFDLHLAHPLRTRVAQQRPPGSRPTRSTPRRSRTCCAPDSCPRRMSRRASCVISASCSGIARR
jgi:transposase